MVIAYHVTFGAYGFWLPNDPRGSWSTFVGAWRLFRFGEATKVQVRRSLAHTVHDRSRRVAAKRALKHPPVKFSGLEARAVGRGFARACCEGGYGIHACAILPDHVHLVVARAQRPVEQIVGHLKAGATRQLKEEGLWNRNRRPVWGGPGWRVYLNTPEEVRRAVEYVDQNPVREGLPLQRWSFVKSYEG